MEVLDSGHRYKLDVLDGDVPQILTFVKRLVVPGRTEAWPGTTCQEVIRALIDRVQVLDAEKPHSVNERILLHLRCALVLFEARALEVKTEKGKLFPEAVQTDPMDLHFRLMTGRQVKS